jgi:hypothetical protein
MTTHTLWCASLFASLCEDGVWAVPRSGLIFRKDGEALALVLTMPYDPAMPMTADELVEYQDADFEMIREEFALAGVTVRR